MLFLLLKSNAADAIRVLKICRNEARKDLVVNFFSNNVVIRLKIVC